jgi:hypothetical protein
MRRCPTTRWSRRRRSLARRGSARDVDGGPLKSEKISMTTNRSAPTATVVRVLIYEDIGKAIDWLCGAFGFSERLRAERNGVIGHAQLAVEEGAIMLGGEGDRLVLRRRMPSLSTFHYRGGRRPTFRACQAMWRAHRPGAERHAIWGTTIHGSGSCRSLVDILTACGRRGP